MDSIIALSFINQGIKPNCSNKEFIPFIKSKNSKYFIRPSNFQDLKELVEKTYKPKNREKEKLNLIYLGFLPSGERVEITNDKSYQKEISIISVCYVKENKSLPDINLDDFSEKDESEVEIPEMKTINIDQFVSSKLLKSFSLEIKENKDKLIQNINNNANENIRKSLNDLILADSKDKIDKSMKNLRKSISNLTDKLFKGKKKCKEIIEKNIDSLKEIRSKIKRMSSHEIQQMPENTTVTNTQENDNKNESDEKDNSDLDQEIEKIIFKFNKLIINIEKEINDKNGKEIKINNIQIENISNKEYNSSLMSWFKDENSDDNINFYPNTSSKILPFKNKEVYSSKQNIDNLSLDLIVDNPEEDNDYKMFISIINEDKNIISEKPLEVVVKMKKGEKILTEEEINKIMETLKDEFDFMDLIMDTNEVKKIIVNKKGEENEIKLLIKEMYEKQKQNKINELLNNLDKEMNYSKFIKRDEVIEEIENLKFDEKEIKNWIKKKIDKLKPEPKPEKKDDDNKKKDDDKKKNDDDNKKNDDDNGNNDEKKIESIISQLEEEFYISSFLDDNEVRQQIIRFGFDYKKIKEWVETKM